MSTKHCNYSVVGISLDNLEMAELRRVAALIGVEPVEVIKGSLKYVLALDAKHREECILQARG